MPELPEVQTVLDGLAATIANKSITGIECYYPGTHISKSDLPDSCFPAKVTTFIRRGKYMILELNTGCTIIIHLRMTGKLVYSPISVIPHIHERARILLENDEIVQFIDPRTFGKITLQKSADLSTCLPKLGAEPLSNDFNTIYLRKATTNRTIPIKTLLLDQSVIAGLGNIYVCEILYRAHIKPSTPSKSISSISNKAIVKHTKEVLAEALAVGGTSISDYRRIDDKTGEFQNFLQVYHKPTCPKGHQIENIKLGGRSSFYCPICQK